MRAPKLVNCKTKNKLRSFLHIAFALLVFSCSAPNKLTGHKIIAGLQQRLKTQIDAILADSILAHSRAGVKVVSLHSDEVLYEKDSHFLFTPASNMKLLTTATALLKLGQNFRFKTVLYADTAAVSDSIISGPLYLKGFANPDLTTDDLRWMVEQLKHQGIRRISGKLICDDSYLDDLYWGAGWMWDEPSSWYWAPIGALTVNSNCVTVFVKPGNQVGDTLLIRLEPETDYVKIDNSALTVDSLDSNRLRKFKIERKWHEQVNRIVINGGLKIGTNERRFVINLMDGTLYTGRLFVELLQQNGIKFDGAIEKNSVPDNHLTLVTHYSQPLSNVISNTNKTSDNLSAELILKTLGAEFKKPPGTAKAGLSLVKEFLAKAGVDSNQTRLVDGSGASRYNLISPDQIIKVLQYMNRDFHVQAEFKTSLPIAGVDGTLKRRMRGTPAHGKLRAKTGNMSGISNLSGYTTTAEGERVAFSIMVEHFVTLTSPVKKKIQDRIGAVISGFSLQAEDHRTGDSAQSRKLILMR